MDESKLDIARGRALRAENLLKDDLLLEAWDAIETELVKAWAESEPRDNDGRERVWAAVQANRKHRDYLVKVVTDGKMAAAQIAEAAREADRKKRFGIV